MLRLAIVDDERTIREALYSAIDWESLGFTVIGLYKNGAEAYDAILDEYPDVVLTDLRMPGLSGIELIARVCTAKLDTEFIILSGYGEFELAQQAMRWGVKHYLLKPSSPEQIRDVILSVKEDCYNKRIVYALEDHHHEMALQMRQSVIRSMLTEALTGTLSIDEMLERRKPFIDIENTNYEVYYFIHLEEQNLAECLAKIHTFHAQHANGIALHAVYVRTALIVFFESYSTDYADMDSQLNTLTFPTQTAKIKTEHHSYENLRKMMPELASRLNRFDTITLLDGTQHITLQNQTGLTRAIDTLVSTLTADRNVDSACYELGEIMSRTSDLNLIKMLLTGSLIKYTVQNANVGQPLISVASLLMEIRDSKSKAELLNVLRHQFNAFDYESPSEDSTDLVKRVKAYVANNLDNEELSLKWLAENQFYMNVDYLSKQFAKKSGEKFSAYLTRKRIERAKVLLQSGESINKVAEQVGCGNNPQYFGQLFKRIVGMTPSDYAKQAE